MKIEKLNTDMPSSELDTMKNKVNELVDAINEMSERGEHKWYRLEYSGVNTGDSTKVKCVKCEKKRDMQLGDEIHGIAIETYKDDSWHKTYSVDDTPEDKQEDEECEHDYEELVCKKCGYVDLDCPCGCGMSIDDDEYEESHRANYLSEEKQEDEEVEVTVKRPFRQKHAKREGLETTVRTMPKSEARRLGLID